MRNDRITIERVKPVNYLLWVIVLAAGTAFIALIYYYLYVPVRINVITSPEKANIYINEEQVCIETPCLIEQNRFQNFRLLAHSPGHYPQHFKGLLAPWHFGRERVLDFILRPLFYADEREAVLEDCKLKNPVSETVTERDAIPCYRLPPIMPWQAKYSGHCQIMFDVASTGETKNVRIRGCTQEIFAEPALYAVSEWRYLPAISGNQPVIRKDVKTKMTFRLRDQDGNVLPEPAGFEDGSENPPYVAVDPEFK